MTQPDSLTYCPCCASALTGVTRSSGTRSGYGRAPEPTETDYEPCGCVVVLLLRIDRATAERRCYWHGAVSPSVDGQSE